MDRKKQIYNPFLPLGEYIPDGEPHVFGDRIYLYGSHDKEGGHTFCMQDYVTYSAPVDDLTAWRYEGVIYRRVQDPERRDLPYMFAPDVVQGNDGKYYLYYCLGGEYGYGGYTGHVSVAVSNSPAGPFEYLGFVHNKDGSPMMKYVCFDPAVMNDNGVIRLYYGTQYWYEEADDFQENDWYMQEEVSMYGRTKEEILSYKDSINGPVMAVLEDDMLTVKEEAKHIIPYRVKGTSFETHPFFEGSSIRKNGDLYYFIYSSWQNHELCYATSKYPDRDFTFGGTIVSNGDVGYQGRQEKDKLNMTGTTHGSMACVNGQWYIFFHRLTHKSDYSRQACAEPISILKDGSIPQVEITSCGLNGGPLLTEGIYPAVIACNLTNGNMPHGSNSVYAKPFPNVTNLGEDRFIGEIEDGTLIGYKYFEGDGKRKICVHYRPECEANKVKYTGPLRVDIRCEDDREEEIQQGTENAPKELKQEDAEVLPEKLNQSGTEVLQKESQQEAYFEIRWEEKGNELGRIMLSSSCLDPMEWLTAESESSLNWEGVHPLYLVYHGENRLQLSAIEFTALNNEMDSTDALEQDIVTPAATASSVIDSPETLEQNPVNEPENAAGTEKNNRKQDKRKNRLKDKKEKKKEKQKEKQKENQKSSAKNKKKIQLKWKGYSIRSQLTVIFIVLITTVVILGCTLNAFFLGAFYSLEKKKNLTQAYSVLAQYSEKNTINTDTFDDEMQKLCSIYNINFIVVDADSNTVKTSINGPEELNRQLRDIIFSRDNSTQEVLEEKEDYMISIIYDPNSQMEYMTMWGNLSNNNFFMIRSAMDGIRNSVRLANNFLLYISSGTLIVACFVIAIVSKRISKPILQLANLSERMANLDFEAKYQPKNSAHEIMILGNNFNEMSEKLEETVRDLKNANMELQNDVDNKNQMEEMRKEFMANVSHELKTPIALIQGYAEGLKEGISDDPESREFYCDVIMDETRKMNALVKQLMSLNQLEFGGDVNDMERFDITDVIRNCIASDELLAKQGGINIHFDSPGTIFVWADEFKMEQVFRNYFSNAVHYCMPVKAEGAENPEETIKEINIRITQDGEKARVSVFNTGNPIPEESIPHLWEKFYKVDKARTREYGGSGIGLSIVKVIMESHNQAYGVCNYEDGVEFWFELAMK